MLTVAPREEDADGFVAVHRWTCADVEGWVRAIGLAACAAPLRLARVDGRALLGLGADDVRAIVDRPCHGYTTRWQHAELAGEVARLQRHWDEWSEYLGLPPILRDPKPESSGARVRVQLGDATGVPAGTAGVCVFVTVGEHQLCSDPLSPRCGRAKHTYECDVGPECAELIELEAVGWDPV